MGFTNHYVLGLKDFYVQFLFLTVNSNMNSPYK